MPELPDITVYVECLARRVVGSTLLGIRIADPFVLRTTSPPSGDLAGRTVLAVHRFGKRVVITVNGELFAAIHLMIAGRLHWRAPTTKIPRRGGLAAFDFATGTVLLTESGSRRRASIHLARGRKGLAELDRGGLEVVGSEAGDGFPSKVTAFRDDMAVHGRYRQPCPDCGSPIQRVVYAHSEANYCARCQTEGRLLADRALSRLLKADWPRTLDELEDSKNPSGR